MDIATLGIKVESDGVTKASDRLEDLAIKAAQAAAAILSIGAAADAWVKFDSATRAAANLTGAALEDVKRMANDVGVAMGKFSGDVATAAGQVGSFAPALLSNLPALQSVTEASLTLAEAAKATGDAMTDVQGAQAITAALNQWGVSADDAIVKSREFANVLAAGAKEGGASVTNIVAAMANAGTTAASAKIKFEEFTGAIETMAEKQLLGAEAGTALRNMIAKLSTSDAVFKEMGISGVSATLATEGLQAALQKLAPISQNNTLLVKAFGQENLNASQILIQNAGRIGEFTAKITGTSTAYEQAQAGLATFSRQVEMLGGLLQNLGANVIDIFGGNIINGMQSATNQLTNVNLVFSEFAKDSDAVKSSIDGIAIALIALGTRAMAPAAAAVASGVAQWVTYNATLLMVSASSARVTAQQAAENVETAKAALLRAQLTGNTAAVVAAENALTAAEARLTAALNATTIAARAKSVAISTAQGALALLGGPAGAVMMAAGVIGYLTLTMKSQAEKAAELRSEVDALGNAYKSMGAAQLSASMIKVRDDLANLDKEQMAAANTAGELKHAILQKAGAFEVTAEVTQKMLTGDRAYVNAQAEVEKIEARRQQGLKLLQDMKVQSVELEKKHTTEVKAGATATGTATVANAELNKEVQKSLVGLGQEVMLLGKSEKEKRLYELATQGANEEQLKAAGILLDQVSAFEENEKAAKKNLGSVQKEVKATADEMKQAAEAAQSMWDALAKETATIGMTNAEKKAYDLAEQMEKAGANPDTIAAKTEEYRLQIQINEKKQEALDWEKKKNDEIAQSNISQNESIAALQKEIDLLGITNDKERDRLTFLDKFDDAHKSTAAVLYDQKQAVLEQNSAWESVKSAATSFFEDVFRTGDFSFKKLWGSFKKMAIDAFMSSMSGGKGIMATLGSFIPGMASASGGGSGGSAGGGGKFDLGQLSNLSSLGSAFMSTGSVSSLTSGLGSLAQMTGSQTVGQLYGQAATVGATNLGLSAAGALGGAFGSWASPNAKRGGLGGGAGATIGMAFGGPVGAIAGAVIGTLLGSIGQTNKWGTKGLFASGDVMGDADIGRVREKKGFFGKTTSKRETFDPNLGGFEDVREAMETTDKALVDFKAQMVKMAGDIGQTFKVDISERFAKEFSAPINIEAAGDKFGEQFQKWLSETTSKALTSAVGMALEADTSAFAKTIQSVIEPVKADANAVMELVGKLFNLKDSINALKIDTDLLTPALVQASGGIEQLQGSLNFFYEQFYTDTERAAAQLESANTALASGFAELGLAVPATRAEFRALVEGLKSTETGADSTLAELLKLANSADLVFDAAEAAAPELEDVAGKLDDLSAAAKDAGNGLNEFQNAYMNQAGALPQMSEEAYNALVYGLVPGIQKLTDEAEKAFLEWRDGFGLLTDLQKAQEWIMGLGITADGFAEIVRGTSFDTFKGYAKDLGVSTDDLIKAVGETYNALQNAGKETKGTSSDIDTLKTSVSNLGVEAANTARTLADIDRELAAALESNMGNAMSALQESVNAEKDARKNAYNATTAAIDDGLSKELAAMETAHQWRLASIEAEKEAAQENAQRLRGIADSLKNAIESVGIQSEATELAARRSAQAQLRQWAAGNGLPNQSELDKAISAVSGDSKQFFGSFTDYARDAARTAGDMGTLAARAENQATAAEQTLVALTGMAEAENAQFEASQAAAQARHDEALALAQAQYDTDVAALDQTLTDAQNQYNALLGINESTLSVAAAVTGVQLALGQYSAAIAGGLQLQQSEAAALQGQIDSLMAERAAAVYDATPKAEIMPGMMTTAAAAVEDIPGFASGGMHTGGLAVVGEEGAELVDLPPARIHSNKASGLAFDEIIAELRQLREDLNAAQYQIAKNTGKSVKMLELWNGDGLPETRTL